MIPALLLSWLIASAPSATDALKARETEVRKLLPPKDREVTSALRKQLGESMTQIVDLEGMASASLGASAPSITAAQRKRYTDAFAQRFRRVSAEQVESFRSNAVRYLPEQAGDPGTVKVPTEAKIDGDDREIVYVMRQEKERWRIVDVIVDGVSTVDNFKQSFSRVIAKEGIDALTARLTKEAAPARPTRGRSDAGTQGDAGSWAGSVEQVNENVEELKGQFSDLRRQFDEAQRADGGAHTADAGRARPR